MTEHILSCGCHKVTPNGDVWSLLEQFSRPGHEGIITRLGTQWKQLAGTIGHAGYRQVIIHGKVLRVNRLIAIAFIPNHSNYPESQHRNGDRLDNRSDNLKWGTAKHNAADREMHGRTQHGTRSPHAKLNDAAVTQIRDLRRDGRTLIALAKQFNVSKKLILLVVHNRIWRHVHDCTTNSAR